jgi:hypothetical protein
MAEPFLTISAKADYWLLFYPLVKTNGNEFCDLRSPNIF